LLEEFEILDEFVDNGMIFAGESPLRMDRFSPKVCCSLLRLKSYALSRELLEAAFPEWEVDDADFLERSVAI